MRCWLCLGVVALAACSFDREGLPALGDDDDDPQAIDARASDDAGPPPIDATVPCADGDNDGVCDSVDRCPGSNDAVDGDNDGTPDGCDDWACGPTRPSVSFPITIGMLRIDAVSLAGGGAVAQLDRGITSVLAMQFDYDPGRGPPGGPVQIELGVAGGNRLNCRSPRDEVAGWTVPPIAFGTGDQARLFELTAQVARESDCNSGPRDHDWSHAAPTAPIIGVICVR